jgi:hypothetical protein
MAKNNVIITFSNAKHGDFVIDNWLGSLTANVDLKDIDVVILDYGLSEEQLSKLKEKDVKVIKCECDGHIVVIRFRDISTLLKKSRYKQVMTTDGGDIIFQTDISNLFKTDTGALRAAYEGHKLPFDKFTMSYQKSIEENLSEDIKKHTQNTKMINAGVLIGPRDKFIELCDFCYNNIVDKSKFGPDMVIVNHFLHQNGFKELDNIYNFILYTAKGSFTIKDNKFFDDSGRLIPIVHNAGWISYMRAISSFGYGPGHNKIRFVRFHIFRNLVKLLNFIYYRNIN